LTRFDLAINHREIEVGHVHDLDFASRRSVQVPQLLLEIKLLHMNNKTLKNQ